MDRRAFFKRAVSKATETVVQEADDKVKTDAVRWIRPPYVLDELEFLLTCTRCGECISACPYQVIFPLDTRLGTKVLNTPALDLLNKACHLCDDWPCVTACEPGALKNDNVEEDEEISLPLLAKATINTADCLPYSGPECGACYGSCPLPDTLIWEMEKPRINQSNCIGCALCREACIVEPKAVIITSLQIKAEG